MEKDTEVKLASVNGEPPHTFMCHSQILARDSRHFSQQLLAPHNEGRHPKAVELSDVDRQTWFWAMHWLLPGCARMIRFNNVKPVCPFHKKCEFLDGIKICETIVEDILLHHQAACKEVVKFCIEEKMDSQKDRHMILVMNAFHLGGHPWCTFWMEIEEIKHFLSLRVFRQPTEEEKQKCDTVAFWKDIAASVAFAKLRKVQVCDLTEEQAAQLAADRNAMTEEEALGIIAKKDFATWLHWWSMHTARSGGPRERPDDLFSKSAHLFHCHHDCNTLAD